MRLTSALMLRSPTGCMVRTFQSLLNPFPCKSIPSPAMGLSAASIPPSRWRKPLSNPKKSVLLPLLCLKSWKWVASLMFPPTDSVKLFSAGRSLVVSRMNPPLKSAGYSGAGDFTMAMFSSCELGMMSKENARESASVLGTALPLIQTLL